MRRGAAFYPPNQQAQNLDAVRDTIAPDVSKHQNILPEEVGLRPDESASFPSQRTMNLRAIPLLALLVPAAGTSK